LILLACDRQEEQPGPPIPLDTLPYVLSDILLVEGGVKEYPYMTRDSLAKVQYERVARLHGFSYDDLTTSMQWMQADPRRVEMIYRQVMETLTARETESQ
jgi:hypothetical protein